MFTPTPLRKKRDGKAEGFFLKSGAAVLEQLIRCFNGDCNPIRSFSAKELKMATSEFRWKIHQDVNCSLYRGIHENRNISVKKFTSDKDDELERIANEVAIASRMSSHKNVLKLLGCCLETELPILVYEFPTNGNLSSHIYRPEDEQLPWDQKLRIASGIANAIAYLHHGLSKMTIHRNLHPCNIFVDQSYAAKLFNFQDALQIPEGEAHIYAEVVGTLGFIAPEIFEKGVYAERCASNLINEPKFDREASSDGRYSEKSDVYGFGVLLLKVLTGSRSWTLFRRNSQNSPKRMSTLSILDSGIRSSNSSGQLDFYAEMLQERFGTSFEEGGNRAKESPPDQSDDFSVEVVLEYCESYPQEEIRAAVTSHFQVEEFFAGMLEKYCEAHHPQVENRVQVMEYFKLVWRCLKANPDDRPDMIEVGKALGFIKNIQH